MKRALAILIVSIVALGLLTSGISCTKTVTQIVYVTATPSPKPISTPSPSTTVWATPAATPTPHVLYPNRPDRQPNDVELNLDYNSWYQFNTGLWLRLYGPTQVRQENFSVNSPTASEGKLFFRFCIEVKNQSGQPLSFQLQPRFEIRTPIDSVESPFVREYLEELPKDGFLTPSQDFVGTLQPGESLTGYLHFKAINIRGTYYVIYDYYLPNGQRLIWGFVHDGLSD